MRLTLNSIILTGLILFVACNTEEPKQDTVVESKQPTTPKPKPAPYRTSQSTINDWSISFTISSITAPEESSVYDEIINELDKDPSLNLMIIGHTCDIGFSNKNELLGKQRAEAIYNKLLSLGINADRIDFESAGENNPINESTEEEARDSNRRVSFRRL